MSERCSKRLRGKGVCGEALRFDVDHIGRVRSYCDACIRNSEQLCRTCANAVGPRGHWCAACKRARRRKRYREQPHIKLEKRIARALFKARHPDRVRKHQRDFAARNPNRYKLALIKKITGKAA